MKYLIIVSLFLVCCLNANGQDYLKLANDCFEKGDYECAKRNYTFFQTLEGSDMSALIQKADDCYKASIIADAFYTEKDYEKALDRYKIVLEKNPKDLHASVSRGGSCFNDAGRARVSCRFGDAQTFRSGNIGIRLACSLN